MQTLLPRNTVHIRLQWLLMVLVAVVPLVVGACGASPTPTGPPSTLVTQPPSSLTVTVKILEMPKNTFIYSPETLRIKVGTEVVWINESYAPHTVTSATGAFKGSDAFAQNQSFMMIFTHPGTFKYYCAIHSYMKGTVIVS